MSERTHGPGQRCTAPEEFFHRYPTTCGDVHDGVEQRCSKYRATPPPETAEEARLEAIIRDQQERLGHLERKLDRQAQEHIKRGDTNARLNKTNQRLEARVRALEAFVRDSACGSESMTEDGQHACVYRWDDTILQSRCDRARALLAPVPPTPRRP